jgi:hypothetical protein
MLHDVPQSSGLGPVAKFIRRRYVPWLLKPFVKGFVLVGFLGIFVLSVISVQHIQLGLGTVIMSLCPKPATYLTTSQIRSSRCHRNRTSSSISRVWRSTWTLVHRSISYPEIRMLRFVRVSNICAVASPLAKTSPWQTYWNQSDNNAGIHHSLPSLPLHGSTITYSGWIRRRNLAVVCVSATQSYSVGLRSRNDFASLVSRVGNPPGTSP